MNMQLSFSPMRSSEQLTLERRDDVLIVNGTEFDFSGLATLESVLPTGPNSEWFVGAVVRQPDRLEVGLILPHGPDAPHDTLFPTPVQNARNGPISVPNWSADRDRD
ncbi:hypothetical protein [uncultured Shimia sp.]|uniref:hypothetical protein n=1 Tax=uncultured Shimia sp. TaxID=573152 RepID=UPI0026277349|nr:hypothetical protein [uncultured Shimia sp.]